MQRIISTLMLLVFLALFSVVPANSGFFGSDTLVSIDGTDYTPEDFKRWWDFWKEEGSSLPKTPDPYINWLLLRREGKRMELDSDPGFQRATKVFLQSRTLLRLKYDTVDSQIKVSDAEIKKRYEQHYVPRWELVGMEFKDTEVAKALWKELSDGSLLLKDLLERDPQLGGPVRTSSTWLRPRDLEKSDKWRSVYQGLSIGDVVDPVKIGENKVLWYLKDKKGADAEDLSKEREGIYKDIWDEQAVALTQKLISDLRKKYEVKVDEERLEALDVNADEATFTDAPVITTNRQNVSEKEFVEIVRRVFANRPMLAHSADDEEGMKAFKKETAYNVIAQTVTNWEALDRHYEEKEPFKWEYEFNYDHRLVIAVEQRMFSAQATVTDDEIKEEYEQNKSRYSVPMRVKLYIIDETQGPIDAIWADIATGNSIDKVLKNRMEKYPGLQEVPANHLDPEVKAVVDQLSVGETSQIFSAQGVRLLVHLSERTPAAPIPFDRVQESIRQNLFYKKIDELQTAYLENVKASSNIEVNQREWKDVYKELGGE